MQSKKKKEQSGLTALYCRLSRDDGAEGDSNSVANQKRLLQKYAKENSLGNTRFYVDDSYTGTNFNRPSFQKMIEDVEMGYVTAVIVKDISRLGRDYLGVGYYTDTFFPEHNILFIAVNDCVDSDDGENELAPFRNVMNEMYARDISRKVRSAHRIRGNSGEPLGQPPYGYRKDPLNKKHWIITRRPLRWCGTFFVCVWRVRATTPLPAFYRKMGFSTARRTGTKKASAGAAKRRSQTLTDGKTAPFVKS